MARPYPCRFIRLCLMSVLLGVWPLAAHAEDTLIWLLRDLPPITIFEGPQKGQGILDELLPVLAKNCRSIATR